MQMSSRKQGNGLIIGLSVALVGIVLIVFVTFFLLYTRTNQGVGATWAIALSNTRATDGDSVAASALQAGDTYVVVDLTVKNATANAHDFAGFIDFTLKDSAGKTYKTTYFPGPEPPDGNIPAGITQSGTIAFEVPASQHAFTLVYADPVYGTQQWSLTV